MSGLRYGAWSPSDHNRDPDARIRFDKAPPRDATVSALAVLAGVASIDDLRRAKGYVPTEIAREQNGIARGIREAKRRSEKAR